MSTKKIKLFFDGVQEECLVVPQGDELVAYARDGRFVKFPAKYPHGPKERQFRSFEEAVEAHNEANCAIPVLPDPDEEKAKDELAQWLNQTGG